MIMMKGMMNMLGPFRSPKFLPTVCSLSVENRLDFRVPSPCSPAKTLHARWWNPGIEGSLILEKTRFIS